MKVDEKFIISNDASSLAVDILKESLSEIARYVPAMSASGWKYAIETPKSLEEEKRYDSKMMFISEETLLQANKAYSKEAVAVFLSAFYDSMLSLQEKEQVKLYHDFHSSNRKWYRRSPFINRIASRSAKSYFSECAAAYLHEGREKQKLQKKDSKMHNFLEKIFSGEPIVESGNLESMLNIHRLPVKPKGKDTTERILQIANKHNVREIIRFLYGEDKEVDTVHALFAKRMPGKEVLQVVASYIETVGEETKEDLKIDAIFRRRCFYAKTAWEGAIREALALELNNLCCSEKIPYVLCHGIIISGEVPGKDTNLLEVPNDQKYAFEYGKLSEYAKVIGLEDRCKENIKMLRNRIMRHIDFGQAFQNDGSKTLGDLSMQVNALQPPRHPHHKLGSEMAKSDIKANIMKNLPKIKAILRSIDDEAYRKIDAGYRYKLFYGEKSKTFNPRDVLLNYVRSNGWHDIERMIWG